MPTWFILLVGSTIFLVFLMVRSDKKKQSVDKIKDRRRTLLAFIRKFECAVPEEFEKIKTMANVYLPTLNESELIFIRTEIVRILSGDIQDSKLRFLDIISRRAFVERAKFY